MHITTLLRCYPSAWRERYETEMTDILDQHDVTFMTWFDLLRGALDARLDPAFVVNRGPMTERLRRSEIAIFCSFVAFVVTGVGFQKMTEGVDKAGIMRAHAAVGAGYYLVIAGAVIAALAVATGALPVALAVLREAFAGRRRDLLGLLAVPIVLGLAFVGWAVALAQSDLTIASTGVRGLIIYAMVAAALSAGAVSLAVSRAGLAEDDIRFARLPALAATLGMLLSLAGVLLWGLSLRSSVPSAFALNGGEMRSYAYFTWLRVVVVMGVATLVALAALWRMVGPGNERRTPNLS